MSDKVKLPKEVAEAIDKIFALGVSKKSKIIEAHISDPHQWLDHCKPLNGLDLDTLIKAIYIGYEIDVKPEEKIREWYTSNEELLANGINGQYKQRIENEQETIVRTLDLLGIKISGVNAE